MRKAPWSFSGRSSFFSASIRFILRKYQLKQKEERRLYFQQILVRFRLRNWKRLQKTACSPRARAKRHDRRRLCCCMNENKSSQLAIGNVGYQTQKAFKYSNEQLNTTRFLIFIIIVERDDDNSVYQTFFTESLTWIRSVRVPNTF